MADKEVSIGAIAGAAAGVVAGAAGYRAWRNATTRDMVDGRPAELRRLDPTKISADPETFQFKSGGDDKGVTDRLRSVEKWNPTAAGKAMVFERLDGSHVIADGHQRLGLAQRLSSQGQGDIKIDAYVLRERDGWTPRDVRAYAAIKNMHESSGQALDMAKVMRERPDLVTKSLPMSDAKVKDAMSLSKLSDAAFRMVVGGVVKPEHAAAVGSAVGDTSRHEGMLKEMAKADIGSAQHARLYVGQAMAAATVTEHTSSLFGEETNTRSLLKERAQVLDKALAALKSDKKVFGLLEREASNIEAVGNKLSHAANVEKAEGAGRTAVLIEKLSTMRGPVSDMIDHAARAVAEGKKPAAAAREFVRHVGNTLKTGGISALTGDGVLGGSKGWQPEARAKPRMQEMTDDHKPRKPLSARSLNSANSARSYKVAAYLSRRMVRSGGGTAVVESRGGVSSVVVERGNSERKLQQKPASQIFNPKRYLAARAADIRQSVATTAVPFTDAALDKKAASEIKSFRNAVQMAESGGGKNPGWSDAAREASAEVRGENAMANKKKSEKPIVNAERASRINRLTNRAAAGGLDGEAAKKFVAENMAKLDAIDAKRSGETAPKADLRKPLLKDADVKALLREGVVTKEDVKASKTIGDLRMVADSSRVSRTGDRNGFSREASPEVARRLDELKKSIFQGAKEKGVATADRGPRVVTANDFDFSKAKSFRKTATIDASSIQVAKGGEEVVTRQPSKDGGSFVETRNAAKPGDRIVTRSPGDSYVIAGDKFDKMWEPHPDKPGTYRSTNFGKAITVKQDVQIKAPWGEMQTIKKGGVVFQSGATGEVYGNQKETFKADFKEEKVGSGKRGTQNESNLKAIIDNRKANAKPVKIDQMKLGQVRLDTAKAQAAVAKSTGSKAWAAAGLHNANEANKRWNQAEAAIKEFPPERPMERAARELNEQKGKRAIAAAAYEKKFGYKPPSDLSSSALNRWMQGGSSVAPGRAGDPGYEAVVEKTKQQALQSATGQTSGQPTAPAPATTAPATGQQTGQSAPAPTAVVPKDEPKAGSKSRTRKAIGLLAPVGIGAAALIAANRSAEAGESKAKQAQAAGTEAAKGTAVMAGFIGGTAAATKLVMAAGVSAGKAIPGVGIALMAGNAIYQGVTAKPGERMKSAARGAWDMSLPGMIANTAGAVKDAAATTRGRLSADQQAKFSDASKRYSEARASKGPDDHVDEDRGWSNAARIAAYEARAAKQGFEPTNTPYGGKPENGPAKWVANPSIKGKR